jgi:hypothetical protein
MEIPLASAKMTTNAVMKVFMAGLGWCSAEWLWNTVTVGALAKNELEVRDFQGVVPRPIAAAFTAPNRSGQVSQRERHHAGGPGPDREDAGQIGSRTLSESAAFALKPYVRRPKLSDLAPIFRSKRATGRPRDMRTTRRSLANCSK